MTEEESFILLNDFDVRGDGALVHSLGESDFLLVIDGMPGSYGWRVCNVSDGGRVVGCSDAEFLSLFDAFDDWFFAV